MLIELKFRNTLLVILIIIAIPVLYTYRVTFGRVTQT